MILLQSLLAMLMLSLWLSQGVYACGSLAFFVVIVKGEPYEFAINHGFFIFLFLFLFTTLGLYSGNFRLQRYNLP